MTAAHALSEFDSYPILDEVKLQSIKDLGEDDEHFFKNLTKLFFERVPLLITEICQSIEEKNPSALEQSAHALKGTAGNLGATKMMMLCEWLESKGRERNISGLGPLVKQLQEEVYPQTEQILKSQWL